MTNVLIILFLGMSVNLHAQGVFSNQTNIVLEKVIQDYPNKFRNIKGALIVEHPQISDYESIIKIPGSSSCVITQYNSSNKEVLSWRDEIFETKDFATAERKYKEIFNQIRNTIIKIDGEKPYILNGQYAVPDESRPFHSILFNLLPSVRGMQKVKIELLLSYQASYWKIRILIYDTETEAAEQALVSGL